MAFGDLKGTPLSGSVTSITNPTDATGSVAVVVGDLIFAVGFEQTSNTWGTTVTDNLGNTYTAVSAGSLANAAIGVRAYYSRVTVAGTLTAVHLPATASSHNAVVIAAVITGPFKVSPLDKAPTDITQDLSTPYTCPATGTLAQALEVVMSWFGANGSVTLTATSPNLKALQLNTATILTGAIGYQAVSVTTTVSPAWTDSVTPTSDVLGTASFMQDLTQTLSPSSLTDSETFNTPSVHPGSVSLASSLFSDTNTFFAPVVHSLYSTIPNIVNDSETFFVPTISQGSGAITLTPSKVTDTETFYTPFIKFAALTPSKVTDAETFFTPSLTSLDHVTPSKVTDAEAFFTPSLTSLDHILPTKFTDTETFFTPTVHAVKVLAPSIFSATDTFFSPTVVSGGGLFPNLVIDTESFYAPTVIHGAVSLSPNLFSDTNTFYTPSIKFAPLTPNVFNDANVIYSPSVTQGSTNLQPVPFNDTSAFHSPNVSLGAPILHPPYHVDVDGFYAPFVGAGLGPPMTYLACTAGKLNVLLFGESSHIINFTGQG